ncbi:PadR family transcriptional regulator [Microbacterium aurum]
MGGGDLGGDGQAQVGSNHGPSSLGRRPLRGRCGALGRWDGALYASLERLEQQGLIRADGDEIVDGRARRYFVVTDTGRDGLDARAAEFEERARAARAALMRGARTRAVPPRGAPARPIRMARVWA